MPGINSGAKVFFTDLYMARLRFEDVRRARLYDFHWAYIYVCPTELLVFILSNAEDATL